MLSNTASASIEAIGACTAPPKLTTETPLKTSFSVPPKAGPQASPKTETEVKKLRIRIHSDPAPFMLVMAMLALWPFLWHRVMDPQIAEWDAKNRQGAAV